MAEYIVLAGILVCAPLGLFLLHAALSRAVRYFGHASAPPQTVALGAIVVGNIPVAYLAWHFALKNLAGNLPELLSGFVYVLLTYNACCFCYLNALNVTETSLHVNILMRLLVGGEMRPEELARIYGVKDMISARIDRMIALGQLEEKGGRYFLCNKSLIVVGRTINIWRRILGLPLSPG